MCLFFFFKSKRPTFPFNELLERGFGMHVVEHTFAISSSMKDCWLYAIWGSKFEGWLSFRSFFNGNYMGEELFSSSAWPDPDGHLLDDSVMTFVWLEYPIERWMLITSRKQVFHFDPVAQTTTLILSYV